MDSLYCFHSNLSELIQIENWNGELCQVPGYKITNISQQGDKLREKGKAWGRGDWSGGGGGAGGRKWALFVQKVGDEEKL